MGWSLHWEQEAPRSQDALRRRREPVTSTACAVPVLGIWPKRLGLTEGLPCQSLRTSPWMVPHLRYRLHHLQRFCLACREWRGSVSHKQAKSESMCKPFFFFKKKAPCLWSFRKQEKLLSVLSLSQPFQMFTWCPFLRRQAKPYCLLAVPVTLLKGYRISSFWATDFYFFFL